MGCPVHIWLPLMGAAAPFARVARDRIRAIGGAKTQAEVEEPREMKRWAPVGYQATDTTEPTS